MKVIYAILICFSLQLNAQEWVQVASLPDAFNESHHTFGFALEGKGYVVTGGSPFGVRQDFYQYDAETDTWTELDIFPGFARSFAIGDTWDGKAYMGFGRDDSGFMNDLWVFDPTDMSWTELASCPCTARAHPAMVAQDGKIFIGLGNGAQGNLNDWWEYDIALNSWSQKPSFPGLPRHHPFQFGIDEYIYTGFGHGDGFISDRWYRYDPITEDWDEMASIPAEGRVAGTQFSYNGKGYILSGDGGDHFSMETGEFWTYDPILNTWEQLPAHPGTSRWAPASFIIDGEVYLVNGDTYLGNGNYAYVTEVYKFALEESVDTEEFVQDKQLFDVYPNPFTETLNLKWGAVMDANNTTIRIFDMQNRLLFEQDGLQAVLDVSALPKGMLRVEVISGENQYFQMVVKQ